jgi:putative transposase
MVFSRSPTAPLTEFASSYDQHQFLACDFFTVETLFLKTLYRFFFVKLGPQRIHFVGRTAYPMGAWVTQKARQFVWKVEGCKPPLRFLIHH